MTEKGLSSRLKQYRKQQNLTQSELAGIIGIGQTAIANYETGQRFPDEKKLLKIADYFDISLDELLGRDLKLSSDEPSQNPGFSYSPSELGEFTVGFMEKSVKSGSAAVELIIRFLQKGYSEEQIILDLLKPALKRAGDLWAGGIYNEAMEHQLSSTVLQSLFTMKAMSIQPEKRRGRFTALAASGEQHDIGLRMLSRFLEIEGWESFFLGSSVPAASLVEFNNENKIDLVLVSATLNEHVDSLCYMVKAIKSADSPPIVIAGGRAVELNRGRIMGAGADYITDSIETAVKMSRKVRGSE